jgi:formyltetrahydrofolate hydrolase
MTNSFSGPPGESIITPPQAKPNDEPVLPTVKPARLYVLTASCPDTTGIVAAVAGFLTQSEDLPVIGSELETVVLNRAIKWPAARRAFGNGNSIVVLK